MFGGEKIHTTLLGQAAPIAAPLPKINILLVLLLLVPLIWAIHLHKLHNVLCYCQNQVERQVFALKTAAARSLANTHKHTCESQYTKSAIHPSACPLRSHVNQLTVNLLNKFQFISFQHFYIFLLILHPSSTPLVVEPFTLLFDHIFPFDWPFIAVCYFHIYFRKL